MYLSRIVYQFLNLMIATTVSREF